jgi:hypothetical protein
MRGIEDVCDFADDNALYGPCSGPILLYNDNARNLWRCERHARMVEVYAKRTQAIKPMYKFMKSLVTPEQRENFEQDMKAATLGNYVKYVPRAAKLKRSHP